jgi:hypothetical protein
MSSIFAIDEFSTSNRRNENALVWHFIEKYKNNVKPIVTDSLSKRQKEIA